MHRDARSILKRGVPYPAEDAWRLPKGYTAVCWLGEKRCPKAGEWFLSGAWITGYYAKNDLSTVYAIGVPCRVETSATVKVYPKGD